MINNLKNIKNNLLMMLYFSIWSLVSLSAYSKLIEFDELSSGISVIAKRGATYYTSEAGYTYNFYGVPSGEIQNDQEVKVVGDNYYLMDNARKSGYVVINFINELQNTNDPINYYIKKDMIIFPEPIKYLVKKNISEYGELTLADGESYFSSAYSYKFSEKFEGKVEEDRKVIIIKNDLIFEEARNDDFIPTRFSDDQSDSVYYVREQSIKEFRYPAGDEYYINNFDVPVYISEYETAFSINDSNAIKNLQLNDKVKVVMPLSSDKNFRSNYGDDNTYIAVILAGKSETLYINANYLSRKQLDGCADFFRPLDSKLECSMKYVTKYFQAMNTSISNSSYGKMGKATVASAITIAAKRKIESLGVITAKRMAAINVSAITRMRDIPKVNWKSIADNGRPLINVVITGMVVSAVDGAIQAIFDMEKSPANIASDYAYEKIVKIMNFTEKKYKKLALSHEEWNALNVSKNIDLLQTFVLEESLEDQMSVLQGAGKETLAKVIMGLASKIHAETILAKIPN